MQFLVLELVTGETLAERLKKGRLPVEEALDLCRQIAEGLESAHEQGIIHRDIKPANIFITKRGHAKVLDFGLAKLTESPTEAGSAMPTAQAPEDQLTTPGTAMGTVAYMSPEQALGKELDARTDLFSLGVVLYEMATGSQPFRGETSAAISNEIINKAPTSPVRLNPDLPDELETIINKALEKDKEVRCQSAKELLTDLKRLKRDTDSGKSTSAVAAATQQGKRLWLFAVVGLGVAAITVAVVAWFLYMRPTSQESEVALKAVPLTSYVGAEACPSFSPDGNQVAYQWNGEKQDNWDVYVQQVRGEGRLQLTTDPAEDSSPVWSPDGRYIAFLRSHLPLRTELLLISPLGGVERRLSEGRLWLPTGDPGTRFLAWSPDSKWLAVPATLVGDPEGGLYLLSIESGEKRRLTSPGQRGEWQAAFSPDGRTMVLTPLRGATHLYSLDLSDDYEPIGAPRQVTHEATESMDPVWARGGSEIIFSLGLVGHGNASLQRIPVSGSGRPRQLPFGAEFARAPVLSQQRQSLAYVRISPNANIYRASLPGPGTAPIAGVSRAEKLISSTRFDSAAQYSPDGTRIVFRSGSPEIWVCDSEGNTPVKVTSFEGPLVASPVWSPDGKQISFYGAAEGNSDIYVVPSTGGAPRRLTSDLSSDASPSWSGDGEWIYFESLRTGEMEVWKIRVGGSEVVQVTTGGGDNPFESPDGSTLFFAKRKDGLRLWKMPVKGGKEQEVTDSLFSINLFTVVEQGVYFIPGPSSEDGFWIHFLDFSTGEAIPVVPVAKDRDKIQNSRLSVSADGRSILFTLKENESDIMLVEDFQ